MVADSYPLLSKIESPADLRKLTPAQLAPLAIQVREFLVHTVSQRGGHFAAGLGTVELTIALHYIFDTPHDRLVWDVGHQAYPHKLLTGRRERLQTIKHKGGLAPFPSRFESEFDTFGVGHSSTSISAALGMALASAHTGDKRRVVAVIGDGAMTAGQAFEALNHAGPLDVDMLVSACVWSERPLAKAGHRAGIEVADIMELVAESAGIDIGGRRGASDLEAAR